MKQTATEPKKMSLLEQEEQKRALTVSEREARNEENRRNLMSMCERDREKVKGIFRFYESPGGQLSFPFKAYKWDEVQNYTLKDGEAYTIPLGVAKHLNKNGWYPVHHYALNDVGVPLARVGEKKRRFGFQSFDFIDPAEIGEAQSSEIVTVSF